MPDRQETHRIPESETEIRRYLQQHPLYSPDHPLLVTTSSVTRDQITNTVTEIRYGVRPHGDHWETPYFYLEIPSTTPSQASISNIGVPPRMRGKGHGRKLLGYVENFLKNAGIQRVVGSGDGPWDLVGYQFNEPTKTYEKALRPTRPEFKKKTPPKSTDLKRTHDGD